MEDAPNRILMAALDYNFFTALVTRLRYSRTWAVLAIVHCCNNLCSLFACSEDAVSPCTMSCTQTAFQGAPPHWVGHQLQYFHAAGKPQVSLWNGQKRQPLLLLRGQVFLSKCVIPTTSPSTGWSRAQLASLTGKAQGLQEGHKEVCWRMDGRGSAGPTKSTAALLFREQWAYLCHAPSWASSECS